MPQKAKRAARRRQRSGLERSVRVLGGAKKIQIEVRPVRPNLVREPMFVSSSRFVMKVSLEVYRGGELPPRHQPPNSTLCYSTYIIPQ